MAKHKTHTHKHKRNHYPIARSGFEMGPILLSLVTISVGVAVMYQFFPDKWMSCSWYPSSECQRDYRCQLVDKPLTDRTRVSNEARSLLNMYCTYTKPRVRCADQVGSKCPATKRNIFPAGNDDVCTYKKVGVFFQRNPTPPKFPVAFCVGRAAESDGMYTACSSTDKDGGDTKFTGLELRAAMEDIASSSGVPSGVSSSQLERLSSRFATRTTECPEDCTALNFDEIVGVQDMITPVNATIASDAAVLDTTASFVSNYLKLNGCNPTKLATGGALQVSTQLFNDPCGGFSSLDCGTVKVWRSPTMFAVCAMDDITRKCVSTTGTTFPFQSTTDLSSTAYKGGST